jgi:hypothetical protein
MAFAPQLQIVITQWRNSLDLNPKNLLYALRLGWQFAKLGLSCACSQRLICSCCQQDWRPLLVVDHMCGSVLLYSSTRTSPVLAC